jgi:hypothetical protein
MTCNELLEKATALQFLLDEGVELMQAIQKENQKLYKAIQKHKYYTEENQDIHEIQKINDQLWDTLEENGTTN